MTTRFPLDALALTRALVSIDSRNPSLVPGGPGEGAVAAFLAEVLRGWGFDVRVVDVEPGRPNVVARIGPRGARLMHRLDTYEREVLSDRTHPLLGRASLHVAMLSGGTGWSTYAEHCVLRVERRTLPGEEAAVVQRDIETLCEPLRDDGLDVQVRLECAQPPLDTALDADIVQRLRAACVSSNVPDSVDGLWCWTDAALFSAAGIPAVCFGPGDIARAHSATEWVELDQLHAAERVLHAMLTAPI